MLSLRLLPQIQDSYKPGKYTYPALINHLLWERIKTGPGNLQTHNHSPTANIHLTFRASVLHAHTLIDSSQLS